MTLIMGTVRNIAFAFANSPARSAQSEPAGVDLDYSASWTSHNPGNLKNILNSYLMQS